jgi:hypothetical protein
MSRLRRIFVDGDVQTLNMAMEDVLFLSRISSAERARVLSKYTEEPQVKLEQQEEDAPSEVPELFIAMAQQVSRSRNAHYKEAIIAWYMLYDSQLFARFMLQNESAFLQEQFMKALKEMTAFFIAGHKMNGSLFKPGDNLADRRTGHFITRVREMFALM